MKKKLILFTCVITFGLLSCSEKIIRHETTIDNTTFVNPFIGTGGHGHTFPGAVVPNGMAQLSPDTKTEGWDACGGYHYTDTSIRGFSHTHLSGTGIGDLGDFLFMPFTGESHTKPGTPEDPDSGYRSRFSHDREKSVPGYYSVDLLDYNIKAELTATTRVGYHRYNFSDGKEKGMVIDLNHNIHDKNVVNSEINIISDTEISGYKHINGWAQKRHIYFYAKFDQPFTCKIFQAGEEQAAALKLDGKNIVAILDFGKDGSETIQVKVGISSVDYEGAKNNLNTEVPDWNFDEIKQDAHNQWVDQLSKTEVEGGTVDQKNIFYTGLYHTAMSPYTFSDADRRYKGLDGQIHTAEKKMFSVFSLWDTFRAFHPLQNITEPAKNSEFVSTLITQYQQGGILPMWELNANYTGTMVGYHAVPVIVDAYMKGNNDFDAEVAYQAIVRSAKYDTVGVHYPSEEVKNKLSSITKKYNEERGFIPADLENESVAKALEYAYDDWCIAQMAEKLGKEADYKYFMERSKRYQQYFDKETGFMRGVNQDKSFRVPFDPKYSQHRTDDYVEGNAWQWTWFVPHDVPGLVNLMGGKDKFTAKLDELFSTSSELSGDETSADITGLIGQYAHGNEPSHHITHLYNFVEQPWKTQKLTDQIMKSLYFNNPDGLSGNEDCGQMSAWYILNAMGFYSFCPGTTTYSVGRPLFDKVSINLPDGRKFHIVAKNNGSENLYIQSLQLNGKAIDKPFFEHSDIINGGTLEFEMGPEPNKSLFN
ncbi:MAG: putative alpha-1,2-mannosidase [Spirosomataceae bacterium]|jgi:predicted alpha-1,2-mannosidase